MADVDVLVIGGGPAGATTAIAAARLGLTVAVAERGRPPRDTPGESLPPSVRPLLERLGVGGAFLATGPLPCHGNRSAWGGDGSLAGYDFINEPYGSGWHIDRRCFDAMLLDAAVAAGATHLPRSSVRHAARDEDGRWRVEVTGPEGTRVLTAQIIVDASGRARMFARSQGARFRSVDRLVAAVWFLHVDATGREDSTTLVEAVPDGWWYSAHLPNGRLTVAFMTDPDLLRRWRAALESGAAAQLDHALHTAARIRSAGARLTARPTIVSAASGRLEQPVGDRWLAAGDAAATFDPLSSHGIGAALDAGMHAAAAIRNDLQGRSGALETYRSRVIAGYARYLRMWHVFYLQERRWPQSPFWRRRHASTPRGG